MPISDSNRACKIQDLATINYLQAWDIQKEFFNKNIQAKLNNNPTTDIIYFCEHFPVFTLGKFGMQKNLLVTEESLKQKGASFVKVDRGGDITFHGIGQLVVYPIIDLDRYKLGVRQYVELLEEIIIQVLQNYSIKAIRKKGATGVWIEDEFGKRKICAIGIRCSRGITMHGLALNVNTDLSYFDLIHPCGYIDSHVTSIQKELGKTIEMNEVKQLLQIKFLNILNRN